MSKNSRFATFTIIIFDCVVFFFFFFFSLHKTEQNMNVCNCAVCFVRHKKNDYMQPHLPMVSMYTFASMCELLINLLFNCWIHELKN